jgi:L-histidine N-alpha-methyltransferase
MEVEPMTNIGVKFHDLAVSEESFETAALAGFSRPRKALPCKFLYDAQGSLLFDEICRLPEYYPTRTETAILADRAPEIARLMGAGVQLVELGSGSSRKIRLLLDLLDDVSCYVPVDISSEHLRLAAEAVARDHPGLPVAAICADYTMDFELPPALRDGFAKRVAFFPGSTIGNLMPEEALMLLRSCWRLVGRGGDLLIGVDLVKDASLLNAAYNDESGVTARFNLNLLNRINREAAGDFDLDRFAHVAFFNPAESRVEIYIESLVTQLVHIAGRGFRLKAGERIHTEYSYKYTIDGFRALARSAGWTPVEVWTDAGSLFSVHYLRRTNPV